MSEITATQEATAVDSEVSVQDAPDNNNFAIKETGEDLVKIENLKNEIDANHEAAMLCKEKENNPNYLSIIYANEKFYEIFGFNKDNLIGKSYDFLFDDLDFDYSSEDHLEYIRLLKAIKDKHVCSIIVRLKSYKSDSNFLKLKVDYSPSLTIAKKSHALFVFTVVDNSLSNVQISGEKQSAANIKLLQNLERALRNERLLREISYLIVSDMSIRDIAQNIAKILCMHFKADRCLIHDYREGNTNFLVEYHTSYTKPMFKGLEDQDGIKMIANYINFQNHFYEKIGSKNKKSSLVSITDVAADRNFTPILEICEKYGIASQIAITTSFDNKVNGGIYLHQSEKRNWLIDEIEVLEMVGDQFSIALDRSNSVEKVMIANHELLEKTMQLKEALREEKNIRKMQSEFVALVSHEFKTPLQIIDSTRELLVRKLKNSNLANDYLEKSLERIGSGIQRMNGLIHSTLNLARMENSDNKISVEKVVFDLKSFVADIIEKNANLAVNKNVKIEAFLDDLPTAFNGDQKLLDHSFTNIISNAVKYSRNNSTVKILTKSGDRKILIRVVDQGIGIPQDDLKNIGTKFFRAKNTLSVAGTGIGLYLTKHFIEMHGGSVVVDSEINVGTSVTIILPKNV